MPVRVQVSQVIDRPLHRFIEPTGMEIYGAPNEYALEMINKVAGSGIDVSVKSQFISGFVRPKSG